MPRAPALPHILRQHAEMAAFLWNLYDNHLLHPDENPELDMERLVERLEAHLDGLRIAGAAGLSAAEERFSDFPEAGEIFVLRMLQPSAAKLKVADLNLDSVRAYLTNALPA